MICWKIRIFAYWTTPTRHKFAYVTELWFAEKFVSLLIEQHRKEHGRVHAGVVICWKIRIFAYWTTPGQGIPGKVSQLWFAEKFVSLLIEQHRLVSVFLLKLRCDLLKNSYLCLLNNTSSLPASLLFGVVICWKIRIFAYWTTPPTSKQGARSCCDLLKNSYLCLLNNTSGLCRLRYIRVVICWKIRIFAYWTTPLPWYLIMAVPLWFAEKFVSLLIEQHHEDALNEALFRCDLLKNSYLCLLNNTCLFLSAMPVRVVICWKIRIFAYWTTPAVPQDILHRLLWFAEKFVSLLIEQHRVTFEIASGTRCDLLKNSYLCLLNNTLLEQW